MIERRKLCIIHGLVVRKNHRCTHRNLHHSLDSYTKTDLFNCASFNSNSTNCYYLPSLHLIHRVRPECFSFSFSLVFVVVAVFLCEFLIILCVFVNTTSIYIYIYPCVYARSRCVFVFVFALPNHSVCC